MLERNSKHKHCKEQKKEISYMEALLSVEEACAVLKMSKSALYKYARTKAIPSFTFGRRIKFQKAALEKWIEQKMEESNKTIKQ